METYHKIQTLFKRHQDGPKKGKMIRGQWTTPALEFLAGCQWDWTEKVDGTNWRINFHRIQDHLTVKMAGRTDNADLPKPLKAKLEDMFPQSPMGSGANATVGLWMVDNDLTDVTLYGEGYGPKIQNGGLYSDEQNFVLFDVKIGDFWLERENVADVGAKLGLDVVPSIGQGTLFEAIEVVETGLTWDSNGRMKNWGGSINGKRRFAGLKSTWGDFEAEGIVARPLTPLFDRKGDRIITKIKAVDFK